MRRGKSLHCIVWPAGAAKTGGKKTNNDKPFDFFCRLVSLTQEKNDAKTFSKAVFVLFSLTSRKYGSKVVGVATV